MMSSECEIPRILSAHRPDHICPAASLTPRPRTTGGLPKAAHWARRRCPDPRSHKRLSLLGSRSRSHDEEQPPKGCSLTARSLLVTLQSRFPLNSNTSFVLTCQSRTKCPSTALLAQLCGSGTREKLQIRLRRSHLSGVHDYVCATCQPHGRLGGPKQCYCLQIQRARGRSGC